MVSPFCDLRSKRAPSPSLHNRVGLDREGGSPRPPKRSKLEWRSRWSWPYFQAQDFLSPAKAGQNMLVWLKFSPTWFRLADSSPKLASFCKIYTSRYIVRGHTIPPKSLIRCFFRGTACDFAWEKGDELKTEVFRVQHCLSGVSRQCLPSKTFIGKAGLECWLCSTSF